MCPFRCAFVCLHQDPKSIFVQATIVLFPEASQWACLPALLQLGTSSPHSGPSNLLQIKSDKSTPSLKALQGLPISLWQNPLLFAKACPTLKDLALHISPLGFLCWNHWVTFLVPKYSNILCAGHSVFFLAWKSPSPHPSLAVLLVL